MTNADVARAFEELADLMEIRGDDAFRTNAYRRVARTIDDLAGDINDLVAGGGLAGLPGIGKASAAKIEELLKSGRLAIREDVAREVPESLLQLRAVQGLGPKKISLLWKERGIENLESFRAAVAAGGLETLKGFGAKTVENLRRALEFLATTEGRTRLGIAWEIAEGFCGFVGKIAGVERIEPAGSLRRGAESVGDIDLLCTGADSARIVREFTEHPRIAQVLGAGPTKGSVLFQYASDRTIQIDLRVVPAAAFGAALQYFTGSKAHNVRLRELAQKRGWSLNEYGLHEGDRVLAGESEEGVYERLGLAWVPPELREDRGELDAAAGEAGKSPFGNLLELGHIRGDLHMHTTASDGRSTIEEMIAAAKARGYMYICITDHSQSSVIANGHSVERLLKHVEAVRAAANRERDIVVWAGAEVDILGEGQLDYPDEVLAQLDFVVASLHTGMSPDVHANTRRTLAAIQNPYVNLIAHPTGRMINKRDAMPLDFEAIAAAAAETGTALEINASNFRLDLKDQHARFVRDRGVTLCIDCDAHHVDQLDQMRFGVMTARRGWIRPEDVLNTRDASAIRKFVAAKRKRARSP